MSEPILDTVYNKDKGTHPRSPKKCSGCRKDLILLRWGPPGTSNYILTCDNPYCPKFRQPQGKP